MKLIYIVIFIVLNIFVKKIKEKYYYYKRVIFLKKCGRIYNESNLITFEDKLNWLLIHDTNELKGKCADKILLHEYSKLKIGKDICNKILKVYKNVEEINFKELPNSFVIKANHGSGFNIIVNNKIQLNIEKTTKLLKDWIKIDYGKIGAEFHYSLIKRKIFVEEFIGNNLKNYLKCK